MLVISAVDLWFRIQQHNLNFFIWRKTQDLLVIDRRSSCRLDALRKKCLQPSLSHSSEKNEQPTEDNGLINPLCQIMTCCINAKFR